MDAPEDIAKIFFSEFFRQHRFPESIFSDRDPRSTSKFWKRLTHLFGIQLEMSSSHHPQADGASEVMNRMIENSLRCYCAHHQRDWDTLLTSA